MTRERGTLGRHIRRPFGRRIGRIQFALATILVSLALTAEDCSGPSQGVGGRGGASNSPSSAVATRAATPEALAIAAPSPTAAPVASRTPATARSAGPAPTVAKPPTSKPAPPARITFPAGPASGHPGQVATLAAHYSPSALCSIVVHYKSGPSKAQGLQAKLTDGAGNVSWSWLIGTNTTHGQWPITVTCGPASAQSYISVT